MSAVNVNYTIKINNKDIALGERVKASFTAPYNIINITLRPTAVSLRYYEARITLASEDYDIGVGLLGYYGTSAALNTDITKSININSTTFPKGDGLYRISLYAQSAVDKTWDVTYLFMVADGSSFEVFEPNNSNGFEVFSNKEISIS